MINNRADEWPIPESRAQSRLQRHTVVRVTLSAPFQLIIRLQFLRYLLNDGTRRSSSAGEWRRELIPILESLAMMSAQYGLIAYTRLCREVAWRLDFMAEDYIPTGLSARLCDWSVASELYVRRPRFRPFADMLAFQLEDSVWGGSSDGNNQAYWVEQLTRYRSSDHAAIDSLPV